MSPFIEPETMKKVQWVYASDPTELRRSFDAAVRAVHWQDKARFDHRVTHNCSCWPARLQPGFRSSSLSYKPLPYNTIV